MLCSDEAVRFLRSCRAFDIGRNFLSGKIPDAMGSLGSFEHISLHYNGLSGKLPDAMHAMWSLRLRSLTPPLKKITYAKKVLRNYFRGDCDGFA